MTNDSFDRKLAERARQTLRDYEPPQHPGSWAAVARHRAERRPAAFGRLRLIRLGLVACLLGALVLAPGTFSKQEGIFSAPRYPTFYTDNGSADHGGRLPQPGLSEREQRREAAKHSIVSAEATRTGRIGERDPIALRPARRPPGPPTDRHLAHPKKPNGHLRRFPSLLSEPISPAGETSLSAPLTPVDLRHDWAFMRPLAHRLSQEWHPLLPKVVPPPVVAGLPEADRGRETGKITWGLSLAPQLPYAAGSLSTLSMTGGILTEISLGSRFRAGTGLLLGQQAFTLPNPAAAAMALQASDIRLTTLDVPILVNYNLAPTGKPALRLGVGLSSLVYLSERYTYRYAYSRTLVSYIEIQGGQMERVEQYETDYVTETVQAGGLQRFYWGRILNVSLGWERSLSRAVSLTVEPYVKYPLGTVTRQNLRYGTGGVSLRIGFSPAGR